MSAAKKVLNMFGDEASGDRALILRELRREISEGKGIARIQAAKLLWEMMGRPTEKPDTGDAAEEAITFLIAGPLNDDEIPTDSTATPDHKPSGAD